MFRFGGKRKSRAQGSGGVSDARPADFAGRGRWSVTRRRFTQGAVAATGAGMAAIALSSCSSSSDTKKESTGTPQVVTDDSQIVAVLDGDYKNVDNTLEASATWSLPLGTTLFHAGKSSWAAAMLAPESAESINTLGVLSLSSGDITTLVSTATLGSAYGFFDVRCTDQVFAWIEMNYADRSWVLLGQSFSAGELAGEPVKLDEGDEDWEPPRLTVWQSSVIWLKMPLATGSRTSEASHCYIWTVGEDEGQHVCKSPGRFATTPRMSGSTLTVVPRVNEDSGVYYGLTALDITSKTFDQIDQLVLPKSVAPFDATYEGDSFVFSIEASYSGVGSLGNMGTYVGREGGPYLYVRREPLAQVAVNGTRYFIKSQSSHYVVDSDAQTYAVISAPDRSLDYGDYPATEGETDRFLTYATIRDDKGLPDSVTARLFTLS